jgi:hypothetical protein
VCAAAERLSRRRQRRRLYPGQRCGLAEVPDVHGAEEGPALAGLLAVGVASLDADGGEDRQPGFALADDPAELEPGPEPGHVGGLKAAPARFLGDQVGVPKRVAVQRGAGTQPRPPALGAEQFPDRVGEAFAIAPAALFALGVGELVSGSGLVWGSGHRGLLLGGARPVRARRPGRRTRRVRSWPGRRDRSGRSATRSHLTYPSRPCRRGA